MMLLMQSKIYSTAMLYPVVFFFCLQRPLMVTIANDLESKTHNRSFNFDLFNKIQFYYFVSYLILYLKPLNSVGLNLVRFSLVTN